MTPILLDTSFIVAVLDRSDSCHAVCVEALEGVDAPLVTCEAVVAEACYLVRRLRGAPEAILDNVAQGTFQVSFRLGSAAAEVRALVTRYRDVPIDFADACLVQLANELNTGRILTLDDDFDVFRWRRVRRFERLVRRS